MYAKYAYNASINAANLLSDLVKILTGETNKVNLSANCVQASTEILTTYEVAGWVVYDAIAGVNAQCLRAPCAGDVAQFKYVVIDTNTAGYVFLKCYESWNSTTHVGTNAYDSSTSTSYAQRWSATEAGSFDISATARHILMYGSYGTTGGHATANSSSGVFEFGRGIHNYAVGTGYTPAVFCMAANIAYQLHGVGRHFSRTTMAAVTSSPVALFLGLSSVAASENSVPMFSNPIIKDDGTNLGVPLWKFSFVSADASIITDRMLTVMLVNGTGVHGDTLTYNAETYMLFRGGYAVTVNNPKFVVKRG